MMTSSGVDAIYTDRKWKWKWRKPVHRG